MHICVAEFVWVLDIVYVIEFVTPNALNIELNEVLFTECIRASIAFYFLLL